MGFPSGSMVKNLPAKQETWVRSLGWKTDEREARSLPLRSIQTSWEDMIFPVVTYGCESDHKEGRVPKN